MITEIFRIAQFIINSIIHIWPYLVITIPLSVLIRVSGKFRSLEKVLNRSPFVSVLIATIIGAFSPFCSCGVIPVIASLLLGGVPLAPVMSFWLASPSMDPEIFFLSVSMLGWNLAFWRLGATFIMSLSGGYITHLLLKYGWLSGDVLRMKKPVSFKSYLLNIKTKIMTLYGSVLDKKGKLAFAVSPQLNIIPGCGCGNNAIEVCCSSSSDGNIIAEVESTCGCSGVIEESLGKRVMRESVTATLMVAKFMVLAYFLEAVLIFYVPSGIIIGLLGAKNPFSIISAALIGIPVYTSNLTALPMMGALIKQGMSQAAALAFLISGPLTTFPAMAAVWNLTKRKIFFLYVMYSVGTAIIMGYLFSILN